MKLFITHEAREEYSFMCMRSASAFMTKASAPISVRPYAKSAVPVVEACSGPHETSAPDATPSIRQAQRTVRLISLRFDLGVLDTVLVSCATKHRRTPPYCTGSAAAPSGAAGHLPGMRGRRRTDGPATTRGELLVVAIHARATSRVSLTTRQD